MVLLVFLVDTSASMNQKTCLGTTYLDMAKGAVESFLKIRARENNVSRGDRYMLVTYTGPNKSVQAGWRENLQIFTRELKNLQGCSLSNVGCALKDAFDLLNMHRLQSGIDNYGMGRNPYYLEPAIILLFTDGCSAMDIDGVIPEIKLPSHNLLPGAELTNELYRWDQRLFVLNLKIPGFASSVFEKLLTIQPEDQALSNLCELTGGKLYNVGTHKNLMQSMESIAQKMLTPGVIINFEKYGADPEDIIEGVDKQENEHNSPVTELAQLSATKENLHNGFISSHTNGQLSETFEHPVLHNGFAVDPPKIANGPYCGKGLLPSPALVPPSRLPSLMASSVPIPVNMQNDQVKGILPVPPMPGRISPMMFVPNNRHLSVKNSMPNPLPKINGSYVDEKQHNSLKAEGNLTLPKTEAQVTSSVSIPDIPIRGEEQPSVDTNRNLLSPSVANTNSSTWQKQRRMIYVRTNIKGTVGHWPIPESFWPTSSTSVIPPRDCHPNVKFLCKATEPMIIENMPFDKYELEPSPLTQFILERKQPNVGWQTFISGSSPSSELGYPFGYLKASTNLQCVNLFVMPYNYTVIFPLLDELFKMHKCKPTVKWRQAFEEYLKSMPSYYSAPLRNALRRMGAPNNLIPDHIDGSMNYSVVSYLKKVKHQAKIEAERLANLHSQQQTMEIPHLNIAGAPQISDGKLKDFKQFLIQKTASTINRELSHIQVSKNKSVEEPKDQIANRNLPVPVEKSHVRSYKNPFDIHRGEVLQHLDRVRTNFFHISCLSNSVQDEDSQHQISIAQMGNYQDFINQNKPLREVDPSQARVHTFGNPFKLKQDQIIAVDEADVNDVAFNQNPRKRVSGDASMMSQKNKKKRSETPPPSRRAVGPPNTPPPKSCFKISSESAKESLQLQEAKKANKSSEAKVMLPTESSAKNDVGKKHNSVNQQLRKLQLMHKNKKEGGFDVINEKYDQEPGLEGSPILSILRNSFEEQEENDNDELREIHDNKFLYKEGDISRSSSSRSTRSKSGQSSVTPVTIDELPADVIRKARLQLQRRSIVKVRLALWKAIRERAEFESILGLLQPLTVSTEAKYIFLTNLIREANEFQLVELCEKLTAITPRLRRVLDT